MPKWSLEEGDYLKLVELQNLGSQRDSIVDTIRDHERTRHGGGCCIEERINAVAFIAHSLGLAADDNDAWEFTRTIIKQVYEAGQKLN